MLEAVETLGMPSPATDGTPDALAPVRSRRPPGPRGGRLFGAMPEMMRDNLGFYTRCARAYGDFVRIPLPFGKVAFLVAHPDLVGEVLLGQHHAFVKHRWFWKTVSAIFGEGLLTSEGEVWRRERRLMAPAFHGRQIAAYGETMVAQAERMLTRWQTGDERDAHHEMMGLTMRIVAATLFGAEVESDVEEVGHWFDVAVVEIARRFKSPLRLPDFVPTAGNRRYRQAVARLDELVYRLIEERRRSGEERDDLLGRLMAARDEDGSTMSDRQLRDEAVTLFLAGHETTALALSWTWDLLSRHPEGEARLHEEVDRVLGGRPATSADAARLPFTEAVIKESMRLYPPAYAFGREAVRDVDLLGRPVPKGAIVFVPQWVLHRDPRWWREPRRFLPERWLDGLEERLPRYAYIPFGGGPRICIGNRFAMLEAVLILATVAQRFRLRTTAPEPPVPFTSITLRPATGVPVRIEARATP